VVYASPTDRTQYGRRVLAEDPTSNGSLGIAISEAVETAATSGGRKKYSLGSVLNFVLMHQTVIGLEALEQLTLAGEYPDVVSALVAGGHIEARAVKQLATFEAAVQFSRAEGILPAPESAHAIRVAIDEALACKREGTRRIIAFNLSGHGHFDMAAFEAYHRGKLEDYDYPAALVREAMKHLPQVPAGVA